MSRKKWQWRPIRTLLAFVALIVLASSAIGCSNDTAGGATDDASVPIEPPQPQIVEVSPPSVLQELRRDLDRYRPQVSIISPEPNTVLEEETVTVQLQVEDLPTFKDDRLGLGPHLHLILDNQPYIAVYDPGEPLVLEDLSPGTHTLRVFASRPWHESFKNEGAYAQTTFHIYARSDENHPDPTLPLLTYSRPKGTYGAEPIMLDYYLTNAPLHLVAQESTEDEIVDWQIRWTIDGKSFTSDRWQPIYIQGFLPGKHWVQLEFLDELGNSVKNTFNNTVRTIVYEPGGEDTLSKLVRGELAASDVRGIVDPDYVYEEELTSQEELLPQEPEVLDEETPEVETLPEVLDEELVEEQSAIFEEPEAEVLGEEAEEGETLPEEIEEPAAEVFDEEAEEVKTLPEVLDEELVEGQSEIFEESEAEVLGEEAEEGETLPEEIEEPAAEVFDEATEKVETVPEVVEEELIEEQPEVLDEEVEEVEAGSEVLDEEVVEGQLEVVEEPELEDFDEDVAEVETRPEVLEEPEPEVLDEELMEEEERTVVNDIKEIEPIGEEQIENIETLEIELPDVGLDPAVPPELDVPEFSQLEEEADATQTSLETSAVQLDRDILEEMPAQEGNPEPLETPMEEIELL